MNKVTPLSQYIKDLSFENFAAQQNNFNSKNFHLNIKMNVSKKKLHGNFIEVALEILLEAKEDSEKIFILELIYASTFEINETLLEDKKQIVFVDCPTIMFPFVRQIIFNLTRDSGFKPVNLDYVDFNKIFQHKKSS